MKKLILSGELPCSKEEAAVLAVIQLRVEETSPHEDNNMSAQTGHVGGSGTHRPETILKTLAHIADDKRRTNTLEDNKVRQSKPVR